MKGLIVYSSMSGNTKLYAEKINEKINDLLEIDIFPIRKIKNIDLNNYDLIIEGFWGNRTTTDDKSMEFLKSLESKNVLLFGTLGAFPNSEHGINTANAARDLIIEKNNFLGCVLINGQVSKKATFAIKLIPPFAVSKELRERMYNTAVNSRNATPEEYEIALDKIRNIVFDFISK